MFKHILLAYDGSETARQAAARAAELARALPGLVRVRVVVAVEAVPANLGEPNFSRLATERTLAGQALLAEAHGLLGEGLEVHDELLFGPPAEEILTVAEVRGCDLIVMGTRGHSPWQGLLFGSNAQRVISRAPCPVLVVR